MENSSNENRNKPVLIPIVGSLEQVNSILEMDDLRKIFWKKTNLIGQINYHFRLMRGTTKL